MALRRGCGLLGVVATVTLLCACAAAATSYWAVGPSLGCENPVRGPAQPGWSARTVVSDDLERCYHLYVPRGYDPSQPAPVVVSMHGFLSNPNSHAVISGWHRLADRAGREPDLGREQSEFLPYPDCFQSPEYSNLQPSPV